jgi:plasmid stabilization system protein ParE
MRYRVLPSAFEDLNDIDMYVLENFGISYAVDTQGRLFDTFDLLADFPHMGAARPDIVRAPKRLFALKPYWIVYEPGTPLLIHRVYHSARDLRRINRLR